MGSSVIHGPGDDSWIGTLVDGLSTHHNDGQSTSGQRELRAGERNSKFTECTSGDDDAAVEGAQPTTCS
jgi:hypothetical protein